MRIFLLFAFLSSFAVTVCPVQAYLGATEAQCVAAYGKVVKEAKDDENEKYYIYHSAKYGEVKVYFFEGEAISACYDVPGKTVDAALARELRALNGGHWKATKARNEVWVNGQGARAEFQVKSETGADGVTRSFIRYEFVGYHRT